MPEQIDDNYDFSRYGPLLSQVLDGRTWCCRPEADFRCKPATLAAYVRAGARQRNLMVEVKVEDDGAVVLRAQPKPALAVAQ